MDGAPSPTLGAALERIWRTPSTSEEDEDWQWTRPCELPEVLVFPSPPVYDTRLALVSADLEERLRECPRPRDWGQFPDALVVKVAKTTNGGSIYMVLWAHPAHPEHPVTGVRATIRLVIKTVVRKPSRPESLDIDDFVRESTIMTQLSYPEGSPHVSTLVALRCTRKPLCLQLVTEFRGETDAFAYCSQGATGEAWARRLTRSVLEALAFAHARGIAHNDIKMENVVLYGGRETGAGELIDWGLSCWDDRGLAAPSVLCGTATAVPPEVHRKAGVIPVAKDIWGVGVLAFSAAFGFYPFENNDIVEVNRNIGEAYRETVLPGGECVAGFPTADDDGPLEMSDGFYDFLRATFVLDPRERPEATELLVHPWLTGAT